MTISEKERIELINGALNSDALTIPDLAETIDLFPSSIRDLVYRLHGERKLYIERWIIVGKSMAYTAAYRLGDLPDAPKPPKMTKEQRAAKMRIYRANYEQSKAQKAEREYRERVRRELLRPAFRHWMDVALFGEPA